MKNTNLLLALLLSLFSANIFTACNTGHGEESDVNRQWSKEKANLWWQETGWLSGCNFQPSTAVNALEMWQEDTFDPATIDRELGYAEDLGFNVMRVWLNSLAWKSDPDGFKGRVNSYLTIADSHGIGTMFVFFCDCWNPNSKAGAQPEPEPGVHNSQWVQDPSNDLRADTSSLYAWLEKYVRDIMIAFKDDKRVLVWDLYNEPRGKSLSLVKNAFRWAREVNPSQPLTVDIFNDHNLNLFVVNNSDIITYHNYSDLGHHSTVVRLLKLFERPLICTEWMARHFDSKFQNILPWLQKESVGAISWGLVAGKTNTYYKWGEPVPDSSEPELWFHDILRKDGTPFDIAETDTIKAVNARR